MGIPDHLKGLMTNLYVGQEATVKTIHGTIDWKKYIKVAFCQLSYLTYTEYLMQNPGLFEAQARIKISRRNINNFEYVDDTTLFVDSKRN